MGEVEMPCRVRWVGRNCLPKPLHCLPALADAEQQPSGSAVGPRGSGAVAVGQGGVGGLIEMRQRPRAVAHALRILALMMTHELKVPAAAIPKQADSSYRGFLIDMVGTITCMVYRQCGAEIVDDDALRDATDDEDHAVRIRSVQQTMLVSYLRNYDSSDSVPFLLNLWLADGDTADEERQQQLSGLSDDESKPMAIEDSLEDVRAASLELARSRDLLKMKSVLLERIVAMFQDNNITLRSKAMKVLSNLIEVCEAIFADEKVKSAVKKNLYDAAVSVR